MSHGFEFMGMSPKGILYLAASGVFIAYLSTGFKGFNQHKYQPAPEILKIMKETGPSGISYDDYVGKKYGE